MPLIRYGMIGGGPGAFIGAVHRMATALDGRFQLVAGAFASNPARSQVAGSEFGLDPSRVYGSFKEMADAESRLPKSECMEVAVIATPNHLHYPVARTFLKRGFHVICDKPFTTKLVEAEELCRLAAPPLAVPCVELAVPCVEKEKQDRPLCAVTFNYSGYPMVREARELIKSGKLGTVRKVIVEYIQGWLSTLLEDLGQEAGHKQAEWRADPERGGASAVLGDIGTHAHHLLRYVTGLEVADLRAELGTVVAGRRAHDDATVHIRLDNGASALLMALQAATGERNHLRIRVYGSRGGLDWLQERPGRLRLLGMDGTERMVHRATRASPPATAATRLPAGHPEGFIEAFANLYGCFADDLLGLSGSSDFPLAGAGYPTARDGAYGVHFVERAVESSLRGEWVSAEYTPP